MEKLRNRFLLELHECGFSAKDTESIISAFERASDGFIVEERGTDIIPLGGLPDPVKAFLATKHIEGCSESTIAGYKINLELFFDRVRIPLKDITANTVRTYLYAYQKERGISNASLDKIRTCLNSLFTWLAGEEYITRSPMLTIKPIKKEQKQRKALTRVELEKLRRACVSVRDKAIIETLFSTGCRISELASIRIDQVNFQNGEIIVTGKGNKQRFVYLNAPSILAMMEYLKSRKDECPMLFVGVRAPHNKITSRQLERIVGDLSEKAQIGRISPHILRHTTATLALKAGMPIQDIQRLLGHSQISTTMIYAEIDQAEVKSEHMRCVV